MSNDDEIPDKEFLNAIAELETSPYDGQRNAHEIWQEWSAGGEISLKGHPSSSESFRAVHTLLHVLWDFNEKHNAEDVLLEWIDANDWADDFEAFLMAHYEKAND